MALVASKVQAVRADVAGLAGLRWVDPLLAMAVHASLLQRGVEPDGQVVVGYVAAVTTGAGHLSVSMQVGGVRAGMADRAILLGMGGRLGQGRGLEEARVDQAQVAANTSHLTSMSAVGDPEGGLRQDLRQAVPRMATQAAPVLDVGLGW
jgi:hypothetical protein